MIYLDNSATTRVCEAAVRAATACMTEGYYNPSALYMPSMAVEKEMNACRDTILRAVDAGGDARVVFTSGGTEADNLAILGGMEHMRGGRVLYSAGEHPAVREACEHLKNMDAQEIPLAADGRVRLDRLEELLTPDTKHAHRGDRPAARPSLSRGSTARGRGTGLPARPLLHA